MNIYITNDLKNQFHVVCVLRDLKMSHIVVEMIEHLLASKAQSMGQELL
jgi:hypothetical protein